MNYQVGTNPVFVVGGDNERINSVRTTIYTPIDFNRDGKRDIAAVNRGSNSVSILLGNGDGTYRGPTNYPTGANPSGVSAFAPHLAVTDYDDKDVSIFAGHGDGAVDLRRRA